MGRKLQRPEEAERYLRGMLMELLGVPRAREILNILGMRGQARCLLSEREAIELLREGRPQSDSSLGSFYDITVEHDYVIELVLCIRERWSKEE